MVDRGTDGADALALDENLAGLEQVVRYPPGAGARRAARSAQWGLLRQNCCAARHSDEGDQQ